MADGIRMTLADTEVAVHLTQMRKNGQSMRPFMGTVSAIIMRSVASNFRAGGRPTWKVLSPWTRSVRSAGGTTAKHSLGQDTLQASGRLRKSVTMMRGADAIRTFSDTGLMWGTNVPYGGLQQFGGVVKPKSSKWLALPFPGVTGKPRDYKDTFFFKSKKGNLILARGYSLVSRRRAQFAGPDGKVKVKTVTVRTEGQLTPLFLMRASVTVPSRPFLFWHDDDVKTLAALAAAFAFDPAGYAALAGRMKSAGGGEI